jgi:hypothetical protein
MTDRPAWLDRPGVAEAGLEARDDGHASTREPGRYGSHCFVLRRPR